MKNDLSEIALSVYKNDNQILNESKLGDAFNAFLGSFGVSKSTDATFIFTLVGNKLEKCLDIIKNASNDSGTEFRINPITFLSNMIERLELIRKNIKNNQKYTAEDGEMVQEISPGVSANIAIDFSNAIIGALQDS